MTTLIALTVRELKAFWYSPIAYVVGVFFLLLQGFIFWLLVVMLSGPGADTSWTINQAFFGTFFYWISVLTIVPLITMRTFSEEKRTGAFELLLTAPVTEPQIVVAKFLGAWLSYCALWAMTGFYFLLLSRLTALDWGGIATGYLGTWLLGAVLIAVGVLASSLTRNQIIAAVISFVLLLLLFCVSFLQNFVTSPETRKLVQYCSVLEHFQDFSKGILDTRPIIFYGSALAALLFLTIRAVGSPRWRS